MCPPERIRERVEAFVEGGITLPIMLPVAPPERMGELIDALAPD
jgi:hypothetical protein